MKYEAPTDEEFHQFYHKTLKPELEEFETVRIRQAYGIIITFGLTLAVIGVLIFRSENLAMGALKWIILSPVVFFGVAIVCVPVFMIFDPVYNKVMKSMKSKDYRGEFKRTIVTEICKFIDLDLAYDPKGHISKTDYMDCGVFEPPKLRYSGEDLIEGAIGGTRIQFSEVLAVSYREEGNFFGLIFMADFNKPFSGKTIVMPDYAEKNMGRIGRKFQKLKKRWGELIHLEDPAFEELFVVYSSDQIEARYILSPALMHRITRFRKEYNREMAFSFTKSRLYIIIPAMSANSLQGKNFFEPRWFSSVLNEQLIKSYIDDILFGVMVVEEMNLNTRIWRRIDENAGNIGD